MNKKTKQIQQVDLNIAKEVVRICDAYKLKYYIIGGTLLGAIRHKGFIPWDDDIDLAMPREDYEKFLEISKVEIDKKFKIVNFKTDPLYQYYITRVLDLDTEVIESRIGNEYRNTYASIDIFPIDGTPNSKLLRNIYYLRVMTNRALMSLCYKDSIDKNRKRSIKEQLLLFFMEKLPIEKITTPYRQKCKIDKLLKGQKVENSNNVGTIMGAYRIKEIVPKKYFGEGAFYEFEGTKLRGPSLYHEYLTHMYGDYMKLPPESDRKTHFEFDNDEKTKAYKG